MKCRSCLGVNVALRAQIRLYRVRWFFEHLEYNLTLSLLWVTLIRNLLVGSQCHLCTLTSA